MNFFRYIDFLSYLIHPSNYWVHFQSFLSGLWFSKKNVETHLCIKKSQFIEKSTQNRQLVFEMCFWGSSATSILNFFYFLITRGVFKKKKYCNRMSEKKILPFWWMFMFCMSLKTKRAKKNFRPSVCLSGCTYVRGLSRICILYIAYIILLLLIFCILCICSYWFIWVL